MQKQTEKFSVGEVVRVVYDKQFPELDAKPEIKNDQEFVILQITEDRDGHQHLDIGLESKLNFIRSRHTFEKLPNGNTIHWCSADRFVKI